jgi:diguanylate cyclase (GGDEF)-like protein
MPEDALCYRLGGDAFAVVLPRLRPEEAVAHSARLHQALATSTFEISEDQAISVRAATGIATYPDDAQSARALIRFADRRLQAAKNA